MLDQCGLPHLAVTQDDPNLGSSQNCRQRLFCDSFDIHNSSFAHFAGEWIGLNLPETIAFS
jgi:hypothetical protein